MSNKSLTKGSNVFKNNKKIKSEIAATTCNYWFNNPNCLVMQLFLLATMLKLTAFGSVNYYRNAYNGYTNFMWTYNLNGLTRYTVIHQLQQD